MRRSLELQSDLFGLPGQSLGAGGVERGGPGSGRTGRSLSGPHPNDVVTISSRDDIFAR